MAARGKVASSDNLQALFLQAFGETGVVTEAARIAGIAKSTHYEWMGDPDYVARFEDAKQTALDHLVYSATVRARHGVAKPVMYEGHRCFELAPDPENPGKMRPDLERPIVITDYSDSLTMFLIKKLDPSYRENHKVELGGVGGGAIAIEVSFIDSAGGSDSSKS